MAKWPSREKQFFYHQARTMLKAGMPLERSVELIARRHAGTRMGDTAQAIGRSLAEGHSLSASARQRPDDFSGYEVELLASGEKSGSLPEVMDWLTRLYTEESEQEGRARVERAYIYINLVIAGLVVFIFNFMVSPVIVDMFEGMGTELPIITEWFTNLNTWFLRWGAPILVAVIVARLALPRVWSRYPVAMSLWLTHVPWAGSRWMEAEAMKFAHVLGRGLELGASLKSALQDTAEFVAHPYLKERIEVAAAGVEQGGTLADGLRQIRMFPEAVIAFATLGERRGQLGPALLEAARSRSPRERTIPAEIVQLAIMIGLGGFMLGYAVAVYLPIFSLAGGF